MAPPGPGSKILFKIVISPLQVCEYMGGQLVVMGVTPPNEMYTPVNVHRQRKLIKLGVFCFHVAPLIAVLTPRAIASLGLLLPSAG